MIIKLCGISDQFIIKSDTQLDMVGFNFYPKSKRFIDISDHLEWLNTLPDALTRVGVFVNASMDFISNQIDAFSLKYAQLHGDETIEFCAEVKKQTKVIKVFRLDNSFDLGVLSAYDFVADLFLFDTRTKDEYGGSGEKFDWNILKKIRTHKPFLIAGGIGPDDVDSCLSLTRLPNFLGVDINSKFEITPACKDMHKVNKFVSAIKSKDDKRTY